MANFGIEEDIDGMTDMQMDTDRKGDQSSPHKEISGAVDLQELNNLSAPAKQEKIQEYYENDNFEQNEPSESVDNDIKENIENGNNSDFEPEKPVAFERPKEEEDNDDLFGGPEPEVKQDTPKDSRDDNINDEYDFDIPNNFGNQSDGPKEPTEKAESHHSEIRPKVDEKSESEKIPSEIHKSEKIPSEIHKSEQIEDEIPDNYKENEKLEDQGPAKVPSIDDKEKSEDEYEKDDFEQNDLQKPVSNDDHDKDQKDIDNQTSKDKEEDEPREETESELQEETESEQNVQADLEKPIGTAPDKASDKVQNPDQDQQSNENDSSGQTPQNDDTEDKTNKKKHLRFDQLSDQALYILYTMTIYIGENDPEDLFNDFIYEQLIKTRSNQNMVELITATDFFNVLQEHEVISTPETDEKLKSLQEAKDSI